MVKNIKNGENMAKDIGLNVEAPQEECEDEKCPFHGQLSVRGKVHEGEVVSVKASKTVTVQWTYYHKVPKYERYMRKKTKVSAHLSPCMDVEEGDTVKIAECRPISKTKSYVVVEVLEKGD